MLSIFQHGPATVRGLDRLRLPLPGELLKAYMFEVMRDNWLANKPALLAHLGGSRGEGKRWNSSFDALLVRSLAPTLNVDLQDLISRHSLLPIQKFAVHSREAFKIRPSFDQDCYLGDALKSSNSIAKFCWDCLCEDRADGRAYWHRDHQIHGASWCPIHQTPLSVTRVRNAFRFRLDYVAREAPVAELEEAKAERVNPTICRYLSLSKRILEELRGPLSASRVGAELRSCVLKSKIRTTRAEQGELISDLALASLPSQWLDRNFPGSTRKIYGEFAPWIDKIFFGHARPPFGPKCVLAMALIWDMCPERLDRLIRGAGSEG